MQHEKEEDGQWSFKTAAIHLLQVEKKPMSAKQLTNEILETGKSEWFFILIIRNGKIGRKNTRQNSCITYLFGFKSKRRKIPIYRFFLILFLINLILAFGKGVFGLREFNMTQVEIEQYAKDNDLEKPIKIKNDKKQEIKTTKKKNIEKTNITKKKLRDNDDIQKPKKKKFKIEKNEKIEEKTQYEQKKEFKSKFAIQDDGYLYLRYVLDINRRLKQEDKTVRISFHI